MSQGAKNAERPGRLLHIARVWGSPHGGSVYSRAMVSLLAEAGWEVTILAERFEQPVAGAVLLPGFFQRKPRWWLRKLVDIVKIWRLAVRPRDSLVVVQGDLPRVTYLLLQWAVPLVFIRQDGILMCPGNNRFLPRSRSVCRRRLGFSCLAIHRREGCLAGMSAAKRLGRVLLRVRDGLLLRWIRHFVVNSEYIARIHRKAARVLYPPCVAARGGDAAPQPDALTVRQLCRLVFCGRLEAVKGAGDALQILTLLPECYQLDILGDGPERDALEKQAKRLQLSDRVRFHGWVDGAVRDRCLASAGAVLVPSLWDEAFGMAGLEALAQGTPVVAYDVGGISEWCRDGAGILVRCGDIVGAAAAVRSLTGDAAWWSRHSQAATKVARNKFPPERFGRELQELLVPFRG